MINMPCGNTGGTGAGCVASTIKAAGAPAGRLGGTITGGIFAPWRKSPCWFSSKAARLAPVDGSTGGATVDAGGSGDTGLSAERGMLAVEGAADDGGSGLLPATEDGAVLVFRLTMRHRLFRACQYASTLRNYR